MIAAFSLPIFAAGQQILHGRIERQLSDEVLTGVNVYNKTNSKDNRSDAGGNYKIEARAGDTVIFSSAGYLPDTNYIASWMFDEKDGYNIFLIPHVVNLPAAIVDANSTYILDSLARREENYWLYRQHKDAILSDTNMTQGFGLSFDLNFYSKTQKQKRELRKRLAQEEKDYYIDFRCPPAYVERITGLHGDSLRTFLNRYRPSYAFCRKASSEDIFLYINDQVKRFRHPQPPKSRHPSAPAIASPPPGKPRSSAAQLPSGSARAAAPAYSPPPG